MLILATGFLKYATLEEFQVIRMDLWSTFEEGGRSGTFQKLPLPGGSSSRASLIKHWLTVKL
jgi:hypothetical protein